MNDTDVVNCVRVGHTYGEGPLAIVAVHDVTCSVTAGARIALTGPSGSGKTTLLHMMAGLEPVTMGQLTWPRLEGHAGGGPGVIGLIFQGPSLMPALTALENVAFPLVLGGMPDAEARMRAGDALAQLESEQLAPKYPDELSGGQSQRVAIARVLAIEPALILADEPTGQLDHEAGRRVVDVLIQAAEHLDAALLISTHDPRIADRLSANWRMHDGRLIVDPPLGSTR
ncbi:MAG: ATP-binding cassette domain-containing protein [Terrimesophilobacter sp.]